MVGQVDTLRDRYEELERRKRSEAAGYQNDVRLLQQKMRRIEAQLGRAAISKAKGETKTIDGRTCCPSLGMRWECHRLAIIMTTIQCHCVDRICLLGMAEVFF